jgi:von Willebrand factor type A domain
MDCARPLRSVLCKHTIAFECMVFIHCILLRISAWLGVDAVRRGWSLTCVNRTEFTNRPSSPLSIDNFHCQQVLCIPFPLPLKAVPLAYSSTLHSDQHNHIGHHGVRGDDDNVFAPTSQHLWFRFYSLLTNDSCVGWTTAKAAETVITCMHSPSRLRFYSTSCVFSLCRYTYELSLLFYRPSRFGAQSEAVNMIFNAKTGANPESSVGLMSMGGKGPEVLVTLTTDIGKVLDGLHRTKIWGEGHLSTGIQVAGVSLTLRLYPTI